MKRTHNPNQLTLPHRLFAAHDVDVHGEGLRGALVVLRRFTDTPAGLWATLSLVEGRLRVRIRGLEFCAEARGTWRCRIRVPAIFFVKMLGFPPEGDWLRFRIENDRLEVGQHSVAIDIPRNRAPGQRGSRRPTPPPDTLFPLAPFLHSGNGTGLVPFR